MDNGSSSQSLSKRREEDIGASGTGSKKQISLNNSHEHEATDGDNLRTSVFDLMMQRKALDSQNPTANGIHGIPRQRDERFAPESQISKPQTPLMTRPESPYTQTPTVDFDGLSWPSM